MTNATVYNVKFTSGDKTSSAEIDMKIYNLLYFKNYDSDPQFEELNGMVLVKIEKNNKTYAWPTTKQISDILKEEYSIEIIE
jgi:hypothetical protein